jgi:peroxiredoxin
MLLAVVFATAGVGKLLDLSGSREAIFGFGVPRPLVRPIALLLPLAELATAVALVAHPSAQWAGIAALILLLAFMGGIANAMRQGKAPDCHCFGQISSEPAGRSTLVRNGVLAVVAAFVVIEGPGPSLAQWISDRTGAELVATALGIAAVVFAALSLSLWRDKRDLTRRLTNARIDLDARPPGLPVGSLAPDFSLATTTGREISLAQLRAPGRPVGLIFVSPDCGPCSELFPEVTRWQRTLSGGITLALVSTGDAEDNRKAVNDATEVLLQDDFEVANSYRVTATPTAVVVGPDGRIVSPPASGASIEALVRLTLRKHSGRPPSPAPAPAPSAA